MLDFALQSTTGAESKFEIVGFRSATGADGANLLGFPGIEKDA